MNAYSIWKKIQVILKADVTVKCSVCYKNNDALVLPVSSTIFVDNPVWTANMFDSFPLNYRNRLHLLTSNIFPQII